MLWTAVQQAKELLSEGKRPTDGTKGKEIMKRTNI